MPEFLKGNYKVDVTIQDKADIANSTDEFEKKALSRLGGHGLPGVLKTREIALNDDQVAVGNPVFNHAVAAHDQDIIL